MRVTHQEKPLRLTRCAILVLVSLLAMNLAPLPTQAQTSSCSQEIVVQVGESLAMIAARIFGTQDAVAGIIAATNEQAAVDSSYTTIDDPNTVEAGWKLCIPGDTSHETVDEPINETVSNEVAISVPATTPRDGSMRSARVTNRLQGSRTALRTSGVNLEEDTLLLESLLAARLGEDGVHPLSIEYLRQQVYPGSPLTIEETLAAGSNYSNYLVSYQSEGLKLYATMTVPDGEAPANGWPVVIFVHGYIEPETYIATERYIEHVDAIATDGYIVLRPDLRGHGASEGEAYGAYGDPGYTIDVLNALASIQQYPDADPNRIGMWGHSMGGYIVARAMVVSDAIKAGVIWAGVVAPYEQLVAAWGPTKGGTISALAEGEMPLPTVLASQYGTPSENAGFWNALSATSYVGELSGPVQLHHGAADDQVPVAFSELYYTDVIAAGQMAEYYVYEGDDHNLSTSFDVAMRRSLEFFDAYVKNSAPTVVQSR